MRVYSVEEDNYIYGIFSTYQKAKKWARAQLKEDFSREGHKHMLKTLKDPNYLHLYDIVSWIVDERLIN